MEGHSSMRSVSTARRSLKSTEPARTAFFRIGLSSTQSSCTTLFNRRTTYSTAVITSSIPKMSWCAWRKHCINMSSLNRCTCRNSRPSPRLSPRTRSKDGLPPTIDTGNCCEPTLLTTRAKGTSSASGTGRSSD